MFNYKRPSTVSKLFIVIFIIYKKKKYINIRQNPNLHHESLNHRFLILHKLYLIRRFINLIMGLLNLIVYSKN